MSLKKFAYHILNELLYPVTLKILGLTCFPPIGIVDSFLDFKTDDKRLPWKSFRCTGFSMLLKTRSIVRCSMSSIILGKSISNSFEDSSKHGFVLASISQH
jgi:hypothetical protein